MSAPTPPAPDTSTGSRLGQPAQPPAPRPRSPLPRGWLIAVAVLAVVFVVSVIVVIMVASPPSYEPVPVPSVDHV